MKRIIKPFVYLILSACLIFLLMTYSITQLDDGVSGKMRSATQQIINSYIAQLSDKTAHNSLSLIDKSALHLCAATGISLSRFSYPEASKLLFHYIYGNGEKLELSSSYFQNSKFLHAKIKELGNGQHGPLRLKQKDDWRLSLTLNPYYLTITEQKVTLFHPKIVFASSTTQDVFTVVPIGKLKLKVYDNLISALSPTPFYVFSEWQNQ